MFDRGLPYPVFPIFPQLLRRQSRGLKVPKIGTDVGFDHVAIDLLRVLVGPRVLEHVVKQIADCDPVWSAAGDLAARFLCKEPVTQLYRVSVLPAAESPRSWSRYAVPRASLQNC